MARCSTALSVVPRLPTGMGPQGRAADHITTCPGAACGGGAAEAAAGGRASEERLPGNPEAGLRRRRRRRRLSLPARRIPPGLVLLSPRRGSRPLSVWAPLSASSRRSCETPGREEGTSRPGRRVLKGQRRANGGRRRGSRGRALKRRWRPGGPPPPPGQPASQLPPRRERRGQRAGFIGPTQPHPRLQAAHLARAGVRESR